METLSAKLARGMENAALADRLLGAERLAGLGQLAGGVAHALNNPLAAVMGYAELIAETTEEQRVKEDASMILREAVKCAKPCRAWLTCGGPQRRSLSRRDDGTGARAAAEACEAS